MYFIFFIKKERKTKKKQNYMVWHRKNDHMLYCCENQVNIHHIYISKPQKALGLTIFSLSHIFLHQFSASLFPSFL